VAPGQARSIPDALDASVTVASAAILGWSENGRDVACDGGSERPVGIARLNFPDTRDAGTSVRS
jgi:hypothetical protein